MSLTLALVTTMGFSAPPLPTYRGHVQLPTDLYTLEGVRLAKGQFDVEVKIEKGSRALFLSQNGKAQIRILGSSGNRDNAAAQEDYELATVPIVGTIHLRSSADPLGSDEDRQYSKTGLPQYQDQSLDWKATLRLCRSENMASKDVYFIFLEQQNDGEQSRVYFKLSLVGIVANQH